MYDTTIKKMKVEFDCEQSEVAKMISGKSYHSYKRELRNFVLFLNRNQNLWSNVKHLSYTHIANCSKCMNNLQGLILHIDNGGNSNG